MHLQTKPILTTVEVHLADDKNKKQQQTLFVFTIFNVSLWFMAKIELKMLPTKLHTTFQKPVTHESDPNMHAVSFRSQEFVFTKRKQEFH